MYKYIRFIFPKESKGLEHSLEGKTYNLMCCQVASNAYNAFFISSRKKNYFQHYKFYFYNLLIFFKKCISKTFLLKHF